jgi:hypothetical protein
MFDSVMKKIIILIFLTILTFGAISQVQAQNKGGLGTAGRVSGLASTSIAQTGSIPKAIGLVINQALLYLGIIFFLLVVYAGFLWMSASGNDSKVEKAKSILISAVTGLVIVVSAYAITSFVFGNVLILQGDDCGKIGGQCMFKEDCVVAENEIILKTCPGDAKFICCVPKTSNNP